MLAKSAVRRSPCATRVLIGTVMTTLLLLPGSARADDGFEGISVPDLTDATNQDIFATPAQDSYPIGGIGTELEPKALDFSLECEADPNDLKASYEAAEGGAQGWSPHRTIETTFKCHAAFSKDIMLVVKWNPRTKRVHLESSSFHGRMTPEDLAARLEISLGRALAVAAEFHTDSVLVDATIGGEDYTRCGLSVAVDGRIELALEFKRGSYDAEFGFARDQLHEWSADGRLTGTIYESPGGAISNLSVFVGWAAPRGPVFVGFEGTFGT